ncbi:uncharacterized protein N7446_010491 [Penicillium canescens]|uniref:uncharacterized protein n=1 Tax=Penicillium canescens TaxID=5083 RepID=UPI0026DFB24E|nr:uncharacterized protein N7446_010491 [Penicillium canescens]KAJ6050382.1 hypothetical protein N7446_010491 [Penicillium canescens]KAJ6064684.1 hypothetical protein N7444_000337 [Penicillium canescens]
MLLLAGVQSAGVLLGPPPVLQLHDRSFQPPDILTFVLSTTCWKILVSVTALVLPWLYTRRGFVSRKLNTILGVSIFVLYFVTSIFWLACFAGVVAELGGGSWLDIVNAVIAFPFSSGRPSRLNFTPSLLMLMNTRYS